MTGPATAAVPHPTTVGNTFVKQYYSLLTGSPEKLHRFYKEESTFSHGLGSHPEESVSGQTAINSTILKKHYSGAVVHLDHGSIDCQGSQQGGVVVLVTGVITLQRSAPSHFVQSFFLAVQENGYFVLNDVLRILSIPSAKQQQSPASPTKKAAPAPSPSKATQTQVKEAVKSPKHQPAPAAAVASPPLPASKAPHVDTAIPAHVLSPKHAPASPTKKPSTPKPSTPKPTSATASPVVAVVRDEAKTSRPTSPKKEHSPKNNKPKPTAKPVKLDDEGEQAVAPADSGAPKSWASLFASKKVSAVAAVASTKVESPRKKQQTAGATPSWDDEPAATAGAVPPPPAPAASSSGKPARPVYFSLFIKQVPATTTANDLKDLFGSYGKIGSVNVLEGKGHAFVDFYDEESVKNVLAALADGVQFSVHDQVLHVAERIAKDKASFTSGGRGGGRGRGNSTDYPAGGRGGGGRGGPFNPRPKDAAGRPNGTAPVGGRDNKSGGRGGRGGRGYTPAAN